jgi:signal transduction histidine kinase
VSAAAAIERRARLGSELTGVLVAAAAVTAVTLVLYPLTGLDPGVSSGTLYVLAALLVSSFWGLRLGLPTAVAGAMALTYFHTPPDPGFRIAHSSDAAAICVILLTSVVASVIADRSRVRTEEARRRLTLEAELRRAETERIRLEAVRASGARVMDAVYEERRRVVRDLHDGAQQRLVHVVMALTLARDAARRDAPALAPLFDEALDHAEQAIVSLRELSRGILPSMLTRGGLQGGIEQLVADATLPIAVDVPGERLPAPIEATAYFVVAEALTNVAKHARASRATVSAIVDDHTLRVEVRDDGIGGARRGGSGLSGLSDRVGMLEGRLEVDSPVAGGTRIVAELPLPTV